MSSQATKNIEFITSDLGLAEHCSQWGSQEFIAFDSEFERRDTFYPKVGLFQVCDKQACYLIDPLRISNWKPLSELLQSNTEIVMHSAGEDLNLVVTLLGVTPAILFDTQLAAAFSGIGFSLGYQSLMQALHAVALPKSETQSNWLKRPLTDRQIEYAAMDVTYLYDSRAPLNEALRLKRTTDWFQEENEALIDTARRVEDEQTWALAYCGFGSAWQLKDEGLALLQQLAYWREKEARKRNKPKSWILKDQDIFRTIQAAEVAGRAQTPGLISSDRRSLQRYSTVVSEILQQRPYDLPTPDRDKLVYPLPARYRGLLKQLQARARDVANDLGIAEEMLSRKRGINSLLLTYHRKGSLEWPRELGEWRRHVLMDEFSRLVLASRN